MTARKKDGPERIFADDDGQWWIGGSVVHVPEYIRHDASPATVADMPGVQALLAVAYEAAATADRRLHDLTYRMWAIHPNEISEEGYTSTRIGGKYENPRQAWYADQIRAFCRSLTPADALTALQRLIDEAVAKEREACAKVADGVSGWMGKPHQSNMDYGPNVARNIAAAIRSGDAK